MLWAALAFTLGVGYGGGYFVECIPHAELMRARARRIVDRRVLHLVKMWLERADRQDRKNSFPNQVVPDSGTVSFRLDAGGLDDRPPFLDLGLVERGEPFRRLLLA